MDHHQLRQDDELTYGCADYPLHYACRVGNLAHVRHLVEQRRLNINQVDDHDATPLYLAALTGNEELCHYLLEQGATGAETTHNPGEGVGDVARVYYVALTPQVRQILLDWSMSAATRDPFLEFLRRNLYNNTESRPDVHLELVVDDDSNENNNSEGRRRRRRFIVSLHLHRVILAVRCPRLLDFLVQDENEEDECAFSFVLCPTLNDADNDERPSQAQRTNYTNESKLAAMKLFLEYLYSGNIFTRNPLVVQELVRLLEHYHLCEDNDETKLMNQLRQQLNGTRKRKGGQNKFRLEIDSTQDLRHDLKTLAWWVSSAVATGNDKTADGLASSSSSSSSSLAMTTIRTSSDATIVCGTDIFHIHQCFVCGQSDYFAAGFSDRNVTHHQAYSFREASDATLDLTTMIRTELQHDSSQSLMWILQWMYCDAFLPAEVGTTIETSDKGPVMTLDQAVQTMELASILLCPSRFFAHVINTELIPQLARDNVLDLLQLARSSSSSSSSLSNYTLPSSNQTEILWDKLENACVQVMALHFVDLVDHDYDRERMVQFFRDEMAAIEQRGDIQISDIPLAAEIRSELIQLYDDVLLLEDEGPAVEAQHHQLLQGSLELLDLLVNEATTS